MAVERQGICATIHQWIPTQNASGESLTGLTGVEPDAYLDTLCIRTDPLSPHDVSAQSNGAPHRGIFVKLSFPSFYVFATDQLFHLFYPSSNPSKPHVSCYFMYLVEMSLQSCTIMLALVSLSMSKLSCTNLTNCYWFYVHSSPYVRRGNRQRQSVHEWRYCFWDGKGA